MTFAPDQSSRAGIPAAIRTVLFWVLMVALTVVLWQLSTKSTDRNAAPAMTYSDFMNHVDKDNVASAKLYASQSTPEIQGELRQPTQQFKVTIPKEVIPDLTERMRKQGVSIDVVNSSGRRWWNLVLSVLPFIVILWLFMMTRMHTKRWQSSPDDMPNKPII